MYLWYCPQPPRDIFGFAGGELVVGRQQTRCRFLYVCMYTICTSINFPSGGNAKVSLLGCKSKLSSLMAHLRLPSPFLSTRHLCASLCVLLFASYARVRTFHRAQKPPPDPLAGLPEQPDVENDAGFHRDHDREFERNWHVVALQRDETQERADEIIQLREEVSWCLYFGGGGDVRVPVGARLFVVCTRK